MEATVKSARLLEKVADSFDKYLNLPQPVRISLEQCGVVNSFYKPNQHKITICYELLVDLAQRFSTDAKSRELLDGVVTFAAIHELGHAVIHVLDLPVLGREEDAADELAALIALEDPHGAHLKKPFDTPDQETSVGGSTNTPQVPPVVPRAAPGRGGGTGRTPIGLAETEEPLLQPAPFSLNPIIRTMHVKLTSMAPLYWTRSSRKTEQSTSSRSSGASAMVWTKKPKRF